MTKYDRMVATNKATSTAKIAKAKAEISKKDGVLFLVSMDNMKYASEFKNLAYALGVNSSHTVCHIPVVRV